MNYKKLSAAELAAELANMRSWPEKKLETGEMAVHRWASEYDVTPGRYEGVPLKDLFRHFLANGYSLNTVSGYDRVALSQFGRYLRRLGFPPRHGRPLGLSKATALYFQGWLEFERQKHAEGRKSALEIADDNDSGGVRAAGKTSAGP